MILAASIIPAMGRQMTSAMLPTPWLYTVCPGWSGMQEKVWRG